MNLYIFSFFFGFQEQASKETLQVEKEVKHAEMEVQKAKTQTAKQFKDTSNTLAANGHKFSDFDPDTKPPAKEDDAESYGLDDSLEAPSKKRLLRLFDEEEDEDKASFSVAKASSPVAKTSSSVAKKTPAKTKAPPQPHAETATATPVKKSAGNEKSAPPSALRRSSRKKSAPNTFNR